MNSLPLPVHVVEKVSEVTGTDPMELPPLYETIEPDALDALVDSMGHGEVTIEYAGCALSIASDGSVQIMQPV